MIWIYIASAIFGGAFVVPMLLGALDFDSDAEIEFEADTDLDFGDADFDTDFGDAEFDTDTQSGFAEAASGIGDFVASLLTFRTLVFFMTFFGVVGAVLTQFGYSEPIPFMSAVPLGLFAGVVNARLVDYIKRSEVSSHVTSRDINGSRARVVLPLAQDRKGRIEVSLGGQPTFMVALPYRPDMPEMAKGAEVVVVEVKDGTALVAPLPSFEEGSE